ncbi:MAG: TetR/AcrR family transcriptional regulator [Microbacterium sp.]
MPKVTEEYRTARRAQILDAAIGCFRRHGYARTSISDLVAASGLSAGAIYGNFPGGKKELFIAAADRILTTRREELAATDGDPAGPGEIMATLIRGIRAEMLSEVMPQLWGEAAVDPEIRGLVSRVFTQLRQTVADRLEIWARAHPERIPGEPAQWARRVAPVLLSAGPGFMLQRAILDDFDEDSYLAALGDAYAS